jgi:type IV pilus assembly protein PilY1
VFAGGGLPPSPVSGVVNVKVTEGGVTTTKLIPFLIGGGNPDCTGADCASALGGQKPTISVPSTRRRTYWYQEMD